jgi:hypothetical protein
VLHEHISLHQLRILMRFAYAAIRRQDSAQRRQVSAQRCISVM